MTKKHLDFDSYPYLLEHIDSTTDRISLLPGGHSRESLVEAVETAFQADSPACTLVLGPADRLRFSVDGVDAAPVPPRPAKLVVGNDDSQLEFTETAELFNRYRYLRAWYSYEYGAPLAGTDGETSHIGFHAWSGASKSLKELSTANEVTIFLSRIGHQGTPFTDPEVRAFLRHASWYDRLGSLWDSGIRNEWVVWLAQQAIATSLLPTRVASEVAAILASGGRNAAARLLERFPNLFEIRG